MKTITTAIVATVVTAGFATACSAEATPEPQLRPAVAQQQPLPPAADAHAAIESAKARALEDAVRAARRARVSDAGERRQPQRRAAQGHPTASEGERGAASAPHSNVRPGSQKFPDLVP